MDGYTHVGYNNAADEFLERVEERVDALNHEAVEEVSGSGGVLTIDLGPKGTFVLNKQAPKLQLWLSSPLSGPHHYDMVDSKAGARGEIVWNCDSDGHSLQTKLEKELSEVLKVEVKL